MAFLARVFIIGMLLALTSCGSDEGATTNQVSEQIVTEDQNEVRPAYVLTSSEELPTCNLQIQGQLVYTRTDSAFQY